jgi:hypothetical protein
MPFIHVVNTDRYFISQLPFVTSRRFLPARLGDPWCAVDGKQADKKWLQ